ncbi:MAG: carboxypeptidase-like regulatory domain-containing protein, partial [Tannerella sp.]|nr:carboxypeptidase-like regulatory domain-containing protein [Tannerella sp.]
MKFFGNLFLFLLCSLSVFSQKNLSLTGTLIDKADNEPIVAGSINLLNSKDSTYVVGGISDAKGAFSLKNLSSGNYILKVTYIGYLPFFENVSLTSDKAVTNLGTLALNTDDILLKETIVEGKKPDVTVKGDTLEYDATSFKTQENAVVEDLLKKLPGVEVDKDGKVTAAGKEVKKFLVDGKDFFSNDPTVASKN